MARNVNIEVLINAVDNASKQFDKIGRGIKGIGDSAQKAAPGLIAIGTVGVAGLGFGVKTAVEFESTFAGVRKTVDATEEEFAKLADNFRKLALQTPITTTQLNKIGELAGQLGVRGVDNLTKFTKTIADISVTTNLVEEEAATAFARIANIMQEPIDNVDRMGSVVVDLGNNFATTEREITEFATRIAGAGKIAGLSTRDIFGIGTALSSVGVEAEAGGTAVQKVLIGINTSVVTADEKLSVFAKTAGMSAKEFQQAWKTAPSQAFTRFVEGLGSAGDNAITILSDLGLEDQRLIRAFLSLSNAGDLLSKTVGVSNNAWEENTALTEEANKRYKTTASQFQILKNSLVDVGITLGEQLLPQINKIIESLKPLFTQIGSFISENPKLVLSLLAVSAALGGVGIAIIALTPVIAALATPVGLIAIAIAALGFIWINNFGNIQGIVGGLASFIGSTLVPAIQSGFNFIVEKIMWLKDNWAEAIGFIIGFFATLPIKLPFFALQAALAVVNIIKSINWGAVWDGVKNAAITAFNFIKGIKWGDILVNIGKGIGNAIIGLIEGAIKGAVSGVPGLGKLASIKLPRFAEGTQFAPSGTALVGEQGPELVRMRGGEQVTPNHALGGTTFNVTVNVGTMIASDTERRNFAERLMADMENIALMKGKKLRLT